MEKLIKFTAEDDAFIETTLLDPKNRRTLKELTILVVLAHYMKISYKDLIQLWDATDEHIQSIFRLLK